MNISKNKIGYSIFAISTITTILIGTFTWLQQDKYGNSNNQLIDYHKYRNSQNNNKIFNEKNSVYGLGPLYDSRGNILSGGKFKGNTTIRFTLMTIDSKSNILNMTPVGSYVVKNNNNKKIISNKDKSHEFNYDNTNITLKPDTISNDIVINNSTYHLSGITYNDNNKPGILTKNEIFWFNENEPVKQFFKKNIYNPVRGVREIDIYIIYIANK